MSPILERNNPPKQGPNSNQNRGHSGSRYLNISQWFRNLFPSPIPTKCFSDVKVQPKEHLLSQAQVFSDWHHRKAQSVAAARVARRDGMGASFKTPSWKPALGLSYKKSTWLIIHIEKFIGSSYIFFHFLVKRGSFVVFFCFWTTATRVRAWDSQNLTSG